MKILLGLCWLLTAFFSIVAGAFIFVVGDKSVVPIFGMVVIPYVITRAIEGFSKV